MITHRSVSTTRCIGFFVGLLVLLGGVSPRTLDAFDSGSTGANGAFPPAALPEGTTAITLDLQDGVVTFLPSGTTVALPNIPAGGFADGILHFTTVDIPTGVTLTFIRNAANTPVSILAQGDVTVAGTIDVSGENGAEAGIGRGGKGGPGGFKGGNGEILQSSPGAGNGLGPGGGGGGGIDIGCGGGGGGGFGTAGGEGPFCNKPGGSGGSSYGTSALLPLVGGSGGGGGPQFGSGLVGGGGGGGGGAILIASSAMINISGSILAKGGKGGNAPPAGGARGAGGGSGGAIRLIAETISGGGERSVLLEEQGALGGVSWEEQAGAAASVWTRSSIPSLARLRVL